LDFGINPHNGKKIAKMSNNTLEEKFILNLEVYLGYKLNEFGHKRITAYLNEYKAGLPVTLVRGKRERDIRVMSQSIKPIPTTEDIIYEAKKICLKYEIDYSDFLNRGKRKTTSHIAEVRKEFCKEMIQSYNIKRRQLQDFFKVDHSTIIYYLQGKRYVRKNQLQNQKPIYK